MSEYLQSMVKKLTELPTAMWIALVALLALAAVLLVVSRRRTSWSANIIAYAALAIALSFLLSNIRLYRMPQGGSITPASMLPLMLLGYAFGVVPGLMTGLAYGVLQFLQTPTILPIPPFFAVCQVVLDYLLAFSALGLGGVFRAKNRADRPALALGCALCSVLRYACTVLSGVMFFGEYAAGSGQSPLVYSLLYNGAYMLPEAVICVAVAALIGPRLCRAMRRSARP